MSPNNQAMYNESLVKRFVKLGVAWSEHSCSKYNTIIKFKYNNKLYINYCAMFLQKKKNILLTSITMF